MEPITGSLIGNPRIHTLNQLIMKHKDFILNIHKRLAEISIGASSLRNQGAPKVIEISRNYMINNIKLSKLFERLADEEMFLKFLNYHTGKLKNKYPEKGKNWGTARKALNLFFREVVYNKFLSDKFGLSKNLKKYNLNIRNLEVPLDDDVAKGISNDSKKALPKWETIKNLTSKFSKKYQKEAKEIAKYKGIARIHLDLLYWRSKT